MRYDEQTTSSTSSEFIPISGSKRASKVRLIVREKHNVEATGKHTTSDLPAWVSRYILPPCHQ